MSLLKPSRQGGTDKGERMMHRRSFFEEESVTRRELVVVGVKLVAIVLVLWLCLQLLPNTARELLSYYLID